MPKIVLTQENIEFIKANKLKMSGTAIAKHIGCSKGVVNRFMRKNKLTPPKELIAKFRTDALKGRTSLTKTQSEYIKNNYLHIPIKTMAKEIGKSQCAVRCRMKQLGIEVPKELSEQRKKANQFNSGHVPFNKGKKQAEYMSQQSIEKTKVGRFKKGNIPHNTKADNVIVSRKDKTERVYKYIRVSKSNWQLYHRYLWESKHGKIPDNHILIFKDGDSENVQLENLKVISKTENMYRNSKCNYPDEIIPSLTLMKQLENKLNTIQNG